MEVMIYSTIAVCVAVGLLLYLWRFLDWVWFKPKSLEKCLKEQGFKGNSYRILSGDMKEFGKMMSDANTKPMDVSSDFIAPTVLPYFIHTLNKHGKNSYIWMGPKLMVLIMDPVLVKEVLNKITVYQKHRNNLAKKLVQGVASYEKDKWAKHRRLVSPAFYIENLKLMQPAFLLSCGEMVRKWEHLVSEKGSCELDVWPELQQLTGDVISRTAFGSSSEEGNRIFELLKEQMIHVTEAFRQLYIIPWWRFVPTKRNRRIDAIDKEVKSSIRAIVEKRMKAMKDGEAENDDLLGILLESNFQEIGQRGDKAFGMSTDEIIEECRLFYLAVQETTSVMLVWTMILLSKFQEWQVRAREEVLRVFGHEKPDFEGLNNLKVVTMILYESLRLYPPVVNLTRKTAEKTKLGETVLPEGTMLSLPILFLHLDTEIWGEDAKDFKPERFREGIMKATNGKPGFLPFSGGPRVCVGQNYALAEAKVALVMILQSFSFELSPSYAHAPFTTATIRPQHGAPLIMHKL